jgi:cytochrome P450/MFS family permease
MADDAAAARRLLDADSIPLSEIDVSHRELWRTDSHWPYFARLRREDPVHYCARSEFGPYWSVTRYNDIMAVDTNHEAFSSDAGWGGITIQDPSPSGDPLPMFIAMDPPKHDDQRKVVTPIVAPGNLARMEGLIRERAAAILDSLPIGETFDWVEKVSIELTIQMLATLFDFPFAERHKLAYWSDIANAFPGPGEIVETEAEQEAILFDCLEAFVKLWNQRVNAEPTFDLVSMLAHAEATRDMNLTEYLGNVLLLIIGGNETTRNTITGSVLALNQNPDQYQKLRDHPELIPSMVSETVRWQTPLAHMRRTATRDVELGGKLIRKGEKVVMWYVSGNRDETVIERPDDYIIDRERPRQHMSFGFGIHRCVGNRLAEMQVRVLWEEILKRYPVIEVVGEPVRSSSAFSKGYESLMVRIPATAEQPARPAAEAGAAAFQPTLPHRQSRTVLAGACAVSAAGGLLFNVMPAVLDAAANRFSLADAQTGVVGSSFLAGAAITAATSNAWIGRFNWRALTLGGVATSVAGLAGSAFVGGYAGLVAAFLIGGVGLGLLYTLAMAIVSEHHKPDPAFGVKLAAEVALAGLALLALSSFIAPRWGFTGVALSLAALAGGAALLGLPGIPARRAVTPPGERFAMARKSGAPDPGLADRTPWFGLGALFVTFAGLSGLWSFAAKAAPGFGLDAATTQTALTVGLVASGASGVAAAVIGNRFGRVRPLVIGMLFSLAGVAALAFGHGLAAYMIGLFLAVGLWNFPMAYQMGLITSADGYGRVAVLIPGGMAIGGALGPALAGVLVSGGGYPPLYGFFAASTAAGLAVFWWLGLKLAARRRF